jgi:phosphate transport system substrate-binding protein
MQNSRSVNLATKSGGNYVIRSLRVILCIAVLTSCALAQTTLNGAGATFPYPIYSKWFNEYHNEHSNIQINYQSIGSGGGIRQVQAGTVDFGASDGPMTDQQIAESKVKVMHVPTVLGAVVPAYNIPGVSGDVKFTPDVIADIYLGRINKWTDPRITKVNPGVKFPDSNITVVHRSDGSGTTYIFTDYLSKVSSDWQGTVGKGTSVKWPVGIGGNHSPVARIHWLHRVDLRTAKQDSVRRSPKFVQELHQSQLGEHDEGC